MASYISELKTLVSFEIAKLFWNASFKSEDLQLSEINQDIERKWEIRLTNTRKEAICKLNDFIGHRKLPSFFLPTLKQSIFLLHKAYHQLALWTITYDPESKIDLLKKGELYSPNYFTVDGEFNDIVWAKRFVLNPNYSTADRFRIASLYWFEIESATLWSEFKYVYDSPYEFLLNKAISSLMVLHIEFDLISIDEDWRVAVGFWKVGFEHAVESGYEHAAYYLWKKMPDSEKLDIIENDRIFELMSKGIDYPNVKICNFLFYLLSEERKADLLIWSIENYRLEIWHNLFLSPNEDLPISQMLHFYTHVPSEMYSDVLQLLAHRIQQLQLPIDIQIFQLLWRNLTPTQKYQTLESSSLFIETLAKAKSFCNLSYVIKSLSLKQADKCLLNDHYGAGVNILKVFSEEGEFDLFQKYLSLFLIEKNPFTQNETLRTDAILLLQKFTQSSNYRTLCEDETSNVEEVKNRIDDLGTSLTLLDELCEKVCKKLSTSPLRSSVFRTHLTENEEIKLIPSSSSIQKRKFEEETKLSKFQKYCARE